MKEGIHPALHDITVTCACGHQIHTTSTISKSFTIDICSGCHPYFTGKQKLIDTAGRVERFQKKYAKFQKAKKVKH